MFGFYLQEVSKFNSFKWYPRYSLYVESAPGKRRPRASTRERWVRQDGTEPMSTNATTGDKPNGDGCNGRENDESATETTPIDQHPLGDAIARNAPYAANHGDTL